MQLKLQAIPGGWQICLAKLALKPRSQRQRLITGLLLGAIAAGGIFWMMLAVLVASRPLDKRYPADYLTSLLLAGAMGSFAFLGGEEYRREPQPIETDEGLSNNEVMYSSWTSIEMLDDKQVLIYRTDSQGSDVAISYAEIVRVELKITWHSPEEYSLIEWTVDRVGIGFLRSTNLATLKLSLPNFFCIYSSRSFL